MLYYKLQFIDLCCKFSIPFIKLKMTVCRVSIGREISFVRNNLKWFHSCFTHMHYRINDRINTEVFLFRHSLKSILKSFLSFPAFKVTIFNYQATHKVYIFGRKVSKINIRIIYYYKLIKPEILRQNAR